jgi:hypothetical protein
VLIHKLPGDICKRSLITDICTNYPDIFGKTDENQEHIKIVFWHLSIDLNCIYVRDSIPNETVKKVLHYRRNLGVSNKRKHTNNYNPCYTHSYGQ